MSSEFLCEACGAKLRIDDDLAGKQVKCPQCSAVVRAKAGPEAAIASPFPSMEPAPPSADDLNPYASPTAPAEIDGTARIATESQAVTPGIRRAMSQTRPWVLFLAVLGFVAGGLMALAAVAMVLVALVAGELEMLIVGPIYLLYAALYLACAYYLLLYGRRIVSFERSNDVHDLESALVAQKSFWKLVGITLAVMLVLGFLMAGFALLTIAMAGMNA
jgi:DNA-directed RNA polymerase subunit RPC12/RpoP